MLAHLELAERDALARGPDAASEARDEALRDFGGIEQMKEIHRDDRSARWIENLVKRRALRPGRARPRTGLRARRDRACSRSASAPTPRCSASSTACCSSPCPSPIPDRIVRIWEAPTPTTSNSTTTRTFLELKRAEPIVRGAVGGVAVDRHRAGQRRADAAERALRVGGSLRRLRRAAADRPHLPRRRRSAGRRRASSSSATPRGSTTSAATAASSTAICSLDNEPHRVIGVLPPGAFDRHRARPLQDPASFWRLNAFTPEEAGRQLALAESGRTPEAGRQLEQAQARPARGPRADRRPDSGMEEGLERHGRALRPAARRRHAAAVDLRRARRRGPGAADRVREHHEPAAGAGARRARRRWPCAPRSAPPAAASPRSCSSESLVLGALGGVAGVALAAAADRGGRAAGAGDAVHRRRLAQPARAGVRHRHRPARVGAGRAAAGPPNLGRLGGRGAQQRRARIVERERSRAADDRRG